MTSGWLYLLPVVLLLLSTLYALAFVLRGETLQRAAPSLFPDKAGPRTRRIIKTLAIGVPLLLFLTIAVSIVRSMGRPIRWELPPDYKGWLVVQYEDPSCPALSVGGPYLVVRVPPTGRVCTSSPLPEGWRHHRYEYVHPDGRRTEASSPWSSYSSGLKRENVFIGTRAELDRSWASEPR